MYDGIDITGKGAFMRDITIAVTGRTELLMHNGKLANPMDPATKELGAAYAEWKRAKNDEAFEELCRTEFYGSMYYYESEGTVIGPYWSTDSFHSCLKNAGAKVIKKSTTTFKNFVAAALIPGDSDVNPLTYSGSKRGEPAPRTLEDLWADEYYRFTRLVRVGSSKVVRTRPVFRNWKFEVPFTLDTEVLDIKDLERILAIAGQIVGLGDWRPAKGGRRGRFTAVVRDLGEARLEDAG
jgi:hypothetical protein